MTEDVVTIGDLNSDARGSGARKRAGKPQWAQLPIWALPDLVGAWFRLRISPTTPSTADLLFALGRWQQGESDALDDAMVLTFWFMAHLRGFSLESMHPPLVVLDQVVRVLEFGAKKYKVGNWAKGMPWSVCFASAMSHATKYISGDAVDAESGLPHLAHLMCNLLFLKAYQTHYPEGDDRIKEFRAPPAAIDLAEDGELWRDREPPRVAMVTGDFA